MLNKEVNLDLPNETVGAKRKRTTVAAPAEAKLKLADLRQVVRAAQAAIRAAEEAHSMIASPLHDAQEEAGCEMVSTASLESGRSPFAVSGRDAPARGRVQSL